MDFSNRMENLLYNLEKYTRCWFEVPKNYNENFILLASFPRSGNTWLRFIISNILKIEGNFNEEVDFNTIRYYAPEIRRNRKLEKAKIINNFPIFLKTHFPYNFKFKNYKSVVIIRKPENVITSYYLYLKEESSKNLPHINKFIKHWRYGVPAWINFYKSWYNHYDYLIRYEELLENPFEVIKNMYLNFGYSLKEITIRKAIESSSVDKILKIRKEKGDPMAKNKNFQFAGNSLLKTNKVNLSNSDLEFIQSKTKKILNLYGYF